MIGRDVALLDAVEQMLQQRRRQTLTPGSEARAWLPGNRRVIAEVAILDTDMNADMMSDMKVFTVRDLDRHPAEVLAACDAHGQARIRRRDGRTYLLKPDTPAQNDMADLPDFAGRRARLFPAPLPAALARKLDRAIAGE